MWLCNQKLVNYTNIKVIYFKSQVSDYARCTSCGLPQLNRYSGFRRSIEDPCHLRNSIDQQPIPVKHVHFHQITKHRNIIIR